MEGFALGDEFHLVAAGAWFGKGGWGCGAQFGFYFVIIAVAGEVVPFVGVLTQIVEFLGIILVVDVAPVAVDDCVFIG